MAARRSVVQRPTRTARVINSKAEFRTAVEPLLQTARTLIVRSHRYRSGLKDHLALLHISAPSGPGFIFDPLSGNGNELIPTYVKLTFYLYLAHLIIPYLENSTHLKVVHDCRDAASILGGAADIALRNVFDTQIAWRCLVARGLVPINENRDSRALDLHPPLRRLLVALNLEKGDSVESGEIAMTHRELQLSRSYWGQRPLPHSAHKAALSELFSLGQIYRGIYDRLSEAQHKQVVERSSEAVAMAQKSLPSSSTLALPSRWTEADDWSPT